MSTATVTNATAAFDATLRQGDTAPTMLAILKDEAGVAINLTGASVTMQIRDQATHTRVITDGTVVIVAAALGSVSYTWTAPGTVNPGILECYFKVVFSGGLIETFPDSRFLLVNVIPAIA